MKKTSFKRKLPALILLILAMLAASLYIAFFTDLPERWFNKKASDAVIVGSCAGYDLTMDEVRYVTLLYRADFEERYGSGIWQDPASAESLREELTQTILRELKNNYAILACAKEYLSKQELEDSALENSANEQIEELKTYYGGDEAFREVLRSMNLTEEFLRFTIWVEEVRIKLYEKLEVSGLEGFFESAEAFYNWLTEGNYVYAQYIYLSNDEGEDPEENRALAEQIRGDLLAGADIGTFLASSVNDDLSNVAPRFFVKGLCQESIWQEIVSLTSPGQVSRVIETGEGFYVFLCMEEPEGRLEEQVSSLLSEYSAQRKSEIVASYRDRLTIEWNERGKLIDFVTLD